MPSDKVITGALIEISVTPKYAGAQTVTIGRAMQLNIQESYRVVPVFGIGSLTARELPILQYAGGFNVQQFAISRNAVENLMSQFKKMGNVGVSDLNAFTRQILYNDGIDVTVFRKEKQGDNIVPVALAKISGAVCQTENMAIAENSIVVRDGSFIFAEPVAI